MSNSLQLKAFWNFLQRNKFFTAINIFGFAVSLAFVVLIGLYVQDELSVDDFQANKERIFRLEYAERSNLPPALRAAMAARYPEIEAVTRIYACDLTVAPVSGFTAEENTADGLFVDSSFFSIFCFVNTRWHLLIWGFLFLFLAFPLPVVTSRCVILSSHIHFT